MAHNDTPARTTREAWLEAAVEAFRARFIEVGMPLPERVHVSVGFGLGAKAESRKILGQCWKREASADGVNHIFISPEMGDTAQVLATLLHELIHAADNNDHGHRGAFAEAATRLGLEGPMTATTAGIALMAEMMTLAASLGEYPHGALEVATLIRTRQPVPVPAGGGKIASGPAPQTSRQVKIECPSCGYNARTTRKWLEVGLPTCPCGTEMVVA